jgi:Spy/CpxP family protein refolding chaperone
MRITMLVVCLSAFVLAAQTAPTARPAPPVDAVKQALNLTDAQITQLEQLQQSARTAAQPLEAQIRTRQQALNQAMQQTSPDPLAVGRLMAEIKDLREQIRLTTGKLHSQAVALLTAEQKTKLKALEDAAKLQPAVGQAVMLNLIEPPQGAVGPHGLAGPMGRRGFHGPGGPGGPAPEGFRMRGGAPR